MIAIKPVVGTLALLACLTAAPVFGQSNLHFLDFSPVAFFTDKDWDLMKKVVRDALDNEADGASKKWENSATGHNGTITLLMTYQAMGTTCRRVRVFNSTRDTSGMSVVNFCTDTKENNWKILY